MKPKEGHKTELLYSGIRFRSVIFIVLGIFFLFLIIGSAFLKSAGEIKLNELGDSFGVLNTLFSGLTFAGLIYTIILQRIELHNQQIEIENVKADQKKQLFAALKTAKLNALCSIFQHHTDLSLNARSESDRGKARLQLMYTASQIDILLKEIDLEIKPEETESKTL